MLVKTIRVKMLQDQCDIATDPSDVGIKKLVPGILNQAEPHSEKKHFSKSVARFPRRVAHRLFKN